ncbi:MAG: chromosomal replication initiator protein DnaA [Oribacterium sp.]|nr:chromosomal replication initiator protein DnaA [Eubacterium sp.]MBP3803604.1 chromosomal replication initiator protein DnaA [Oribacterium sp.]
MSHFETIRNNWDEILQIIKEDHDILQISFDTWLRPLKIFDFINGELLIIVPEEGFIKVLEKKYSLFLKVAIEEKTNISVDVRFFIESDAREYVKKLQGARNDKRDSNIILEETLKEANLNAEYTFDTFVVGSSNNLAHAASLAVAESPGEMYNPLYIYGGAGLGKTHLMHSIAHFILKNNPKAKIRYVTSETFMNDFVDSIRNKNNITPDDFRNKYRELDVLLIDDIQFIVGKPGTQEEFFHTFNTLYETKKQIVIASDKPPKDIDNLEDRLRSRFEVGLIVDIQMPDFETRMAILRKKEELMHVNIDNEIIKYIATNIKSNIRELEGALTKIVAYSRLKGQSIELSLAEGLLKDHITPEGPKEITPELIISTVAEHFGITNLEIASQKKNKEIVFPRQIAMYLCRNMTDAPLKNIGEYLGGRDHTTIMHGIDKISTELRTNEQLKSTIETLRKKISP